MSDRNRHEPEPGRLIDIAKAEGVGDVLIRGWGRWSVGQVVRHEGRLLVLRIGRRPEPAHVFDGWRPLPW